MGNRFGKKRYPEKQRERFQLEEEERFQEKQRERFQLELRRFEEEQRRFERGELLQRRELERRLALRELELRELELKEERELPEERRELLLGLKEERELPEERREQLLLERLLGSAAFRRLTQTAIRFTDELPDPHPVACEEVTVHTHHQPFREKIIESIREVEVIEETDFVVSTRGGSFEWKGYGVRLSISEDSLPSGIEECRINIKASLSGPFQLPKDSDLLSPVFWISALCKFQKLVTLQIQHCASRDEAYFADLNFISTKCSQRELPYTFKQLDGGRFPADSSYGSIQLTHFSGIGIAGKKGTPQAYCAQIYYTIKREPFDWRFYLFITKDLDTLKTIVGKHYCQEASFQVRFGRSKISLDIPEDGKLTKEGWRLTPSTHPTIYKKDVDDFVPGLCVPPKCELLVEWDPKRKNKKPVHLRHKIKLIGASKPFNFFNLSLNPTWKDEPEVVEPHSITSGGSVEYSLASKGLAGKYPAGLKSEPELSDLMNEVAAEIPGKWRDVGQQLGVGHGVLGGIATISLGDTNLCYSNVFTRWMNQNSTAHPYTWSTVVQALQAPAVGEERLANKIKTKLTKL